MIVEVPGITNVQDGEDANQLTDEVKQKIAAAGAAAAIETQKKPV